MTPFELQLGEGINISYAANNGVEASQESSDSSSSAVVAVV